MEPTKSFSQIGAQIYEDYAKFPEGVPYELINDYLIREPSPTPYQ